MTKRNVLVFPCGSEIGLEVYRSLFASTHFNLIGGSSTDDHGKFVYSNYVDNIPFVDTPDFVERLNAIIDEHHIDFIVPAHDSVVLALAKASNSGSLHCPVLTSPLRTCETARSKAKTYEALKGIVPTPRVFAPEDLKEENLPVFLKPDVGQGSKGTYRATSLEQVKFYQQLDPSLLILEYLPGSEYTIDCFTDRRGRLLFCEGRERHRIWGGISVNSTTVNDPRFRDLAERISQALEFRGAWFFQVKESLSNDLLLMEIAPRIAGTMGLVRCKGVNLPLLGLFDLSGLDVSVTENDYDITIDRALHNMYRINIAYEHVYLDFDDLVIVDGKVNPAVMAFVYQCFNNRIKVHLLTKHRRVLEDSLKQYRLEHLFDSIIWIKDDTEKHLKITERNAIFIDDSFAERARVHEAHHIPTFDAHMLEALMETF